MYFVFKINKTLHLFFAFSMILIDINLKSRYKFLYFYFLKLLCAREYFFVLQV